MVHGNIRGALLEVADRIATGEYHVAQQLVGVGYGAARTVNEARLKFGPGVDKARAIAGAERVDVQFLHSCSARIQSRFRFLWAAALGYGAGVFGGAELSAQFFGTAFADGLNYADNCDRHQRGDSDDDNDLCGA